MRHNFSVAIVLIGCCTATNAAVPLPKPRPQIEEMFVALKSNTAELPTMMPKKACAAAMRAFNTAHSGLRAISCSVEEVAGRGSGYRIVYVKK